MVNDHYSSKHRPGNVQGNFNFLAIKQKFKLNSIRIKKDIGKIDLDFSFIEKFLDKVRFQTNFHYF